MRITFKDGSFLSINEAVSPEKLNLIVCGMKNYKEVTMSTVELDRDEVVEMVRVLQDWLSKN